MLAGAPLLEKSPPSFFPMPHCLTYIFHPSSLVPDCQTTTYPQLNVYTFHNSPWVISYINGYYTLYIIHCICWLLLFSSNSLLCCESMIHVLFWYIREGRGIKNTATLMHQIMLSKAKSCKTVIFNGSVTWTHRYITLLGQLPCFWWSMLATWTKGSMHYFGNLRSQGLAS